MSNCVAVLKAPHFQAAGNQQASYKPLSLSYAVVRTTIRAAFPFSIHTAVHTASVLTGSGLGLCYARARAAPLQLRPWALARTCAHQTVPSENSSAWWYFANFLNSVIARFDWAWACLFFEFKFEHLTFGQVKFNLN